jgi:hypothetical protein
MQNPSDAFLVDITPSPQTMQPKDFYKVVSYHAGPAPRVATGGVRHCQASKAYSAKAASPDNRFVQDVVEWL